jgi:predicted transcriptional regulator of viral defense system
LDTQNILALGEREARFLTRLAAENRTVFSTAEAEALWEGGTPLRLFLHRLVAKGWLKRLQHGVYLLVPLEAGVERAWSESPLVIAPHLVRPAAVAYWSALHYWQFTEQLPRLTFVQTTRRKRPIEILGLGFRFVTVSEAHYFGLAQRSLHGQAICVTDREKTLIDCADRLDLSGGIQQLALALPAAMDIDWPKLDAYLERWGGGAVVKRLGYLVEHLRLPIPQREQRLGRWQQLLTSGISALEPGAGPAGPIVTRWRLRLNVALPAAGRPS